MKRIAIIGQGYVGLTIAAYAAEYFEVIGFDSNQKLVDRLNLGISHIEGVDSTLLAKWIKANRYTATSKGSDIRECEIIIIAVPTPLTLDRKPDLGFIDAACKTIGQNLTKQVLIINESTSFPGTLRSYIKPAIEKYSSNQIEHLFLFVCLKGKTHCFANTFGVLLSKKYRIPDTTASSTSSWLTFGKDHICSSRAGKCCVCLTLPC